MRRHFENLTMKAARAIRHWWLYLVCGILCFAAVIAVFAFPMDSYMTLGIIFGVLMLINPFAVAKTAMILIGSGLLYSGLSDISAVFFLAKRMKDTVE